MKQFRQNAPGKFGIGLGCLLALSLVRPVQADERLPVAAMQHDLESVRLLLAEKGVDVNALGPYATPAIHWIVRIQDTALARQLLEYGADPNLPTDLGVHALSLAIENGDLAMVQLLLEFGADIHASDRTGETPLMQAARKGSPGIVRTLIEGGANVNQREPQYQQTALMIGVRSRSADVVELLLAAGADVNLQSVPGEGDIPRYRLPSESPASRGVGVNRGGWPDRGIRAPLRGGKTALLYATRQGDLGATKLLVAAGADIEQRDENGVTPLINAVLNARVATKPERRSEHLAVAYYLLDKGADINARDWYGQTPLWAAVELRNVDVSGPTRDNHIDREAALKLIRTLLERGADVNAQTQELPTDHRWISPLGNLSWVDFTGQTPFIRAALSGDVTTMKLLVEHGADPNITTFTGSTALMAAAGVNWTVSQTYDEGPEALLEAVKLAHALGNDINAQNALGFAAIHGAANRGSDDIIRWLAANGAQLDIRDGAGRTAVDWAHGVFLATHPPVDRPQTAALIESLLKQQQ